ncbi:MAG: CHAD domain-containing protein [Candidatus Latescibacterota bacterium]
MTMQSRVADAFARRYEKMREHYLLAAEKHDPEGVHDCRVALKRLKALFRLVESMNPDFDASQRFQRFRKLFKAFAGIRDLHIQMGIAKELSGVTGFPNERYALFLKAREEKALAGLDSFAEGFSPERLRKRGKIIEQALADLDSQTAERRAGERYTALLVELRGHLQDEDPSDEVMHEIRKLSKELHYTREVLDEVFPEGKSANNFFARLKKVHQALGKWHDYDIARLYLKRFAKRDGAVPDKAYSGAKNYLQDRKRAFRREFLAAWDEFLQLTTF